MKKYDTVEEFWDDDDIDQAYKSADVSSLKVFEERLSGYLGVRELHAIPSARWGLYWLLSSISQLHKPGLVLVPAFNCSVVAEAVSNSGNQIEGYDFSSENGSVDWNCLAKRISSNTQEKPVAIIVTHFFGVPVNWLSIRELCKKLQIIVIEDCAHTLGGSISGYMPGILSDASIFSFNYDKPISLGWGGALVLQNKLLNELWREELFEIPSAQQELSYLKKFIIAMEAKRNNIGGRVNIYTRLLSKMGIHKYKMFDMPKIGIGPLRSQLGIKLIEKFENIKSTRNTNADIIREKLPASRIWHIDENVMPSWLKMKVGVSTREQLNKTTARLQKLGYRVGNFNWPSLIDLSHEYPNAKITSQLWLDVPIHQNLTVDDLNIITNCLLDVDCERS